MLLNEGEDAVFNRACKAAAAKLLGVDKVRVIWSDSAAWNKLNDADEGFREGKDGGKSVTVAVSDVLDDPEELDESGEEVITIIGDGIARGEFNDYGGGDDPHYYVPVKAKKIKEGMLDEKVYRVGGPAEYKRGAPADKARAFDKVNPKTGARPNRSVLKKLAAENEKKFYVLEMADEGEYIMVLVMQSGVDMDQNYYGVNVLFYPNGKVDASTADKLADKQWANHKNEIIKVARAALKDPESPMIYDGLDGKSVKLGNSKLSFDPNAKSDYHGYHDKKVNESIKDLDLTPDQNRSLEHAISDELSKSGRDIDVEVGHVQDEGDCMKAFYVFEDPKTGKERHGSIYFTASIRHDKIENFEVKNFNEGKLTFKQFLLAEAKKIKEPGWYVCDHMDKPVDGPMQERGAKEMADEMNKKHADKHGKGDIDPFSAEYFSDYEIKRMNEAACKSDAKRLAGQDVEAIMKAKAEIAKARKDGDEAALAKAKKKLAALTA